MLNTRNIFACLTLLQFVAAWKIILERTKLKHLKTEVLLFNATVYKYNHTVFAGDLYMMPLYEPPNNTMIEIKLFGFYSNTYQLLPMVIKRNLCDTFDFEYKFVRDELKGNFPEKCPIRKGVLYYVKEFVPNTKYFPKCPWKITNFIVDAQIIVRGEVILDIEVYVHVDTSDDYYSA